MLAIFSEYVAHSENAFASFFISGHVPEEMQSAQESFVLYDSTWFEQMHRGANFDRDRKTCCFQLLKSMVLFMLATHKK